MAKIESASQIEQEKNSRRLFAPTASEATLYTILGVISLAVLNSGSIISALKTNYIGSPEDLSLRLSILNDSISSSLSSAIGGRLGQIIVWSFIGAAAYIALWFVKNILNSFENDVIIDHYLHPSNFNRAGYWGSAFAGKMFFGVMVVFFLTFLFVGVKLILPAAATLSASALYHFRLPASILYVVLCVLIASVVIYTWVLLLRIIAHLWKML